MRPARSISVIVVALTLFLLSGLVGSSQAEPIGRFGFEAEPGRPRLSGVADPMLLEATPARPLSAAPAPALGGSDDIQVNGDNKASATDRFGNGEGFAQNETSIAVNPTDPSNVIAGANDYEPGVDTISGVYASFDGGRTWPVSRHVPDVQSIDRDILASGDPAVAFDSEGTAYYATINFARSTCDSWIVVSRSTNKGLTWTMPAPEPSVGLLITPGDGVVVHNGGDDDCQFFHDKEYIAAGPRPEDAPLVPGTDLDHLSPDRLYVVWTVYDFGPAGDSFVEAPIFASYSDDQGRHFSVPQEISGSAPFCDTQYGDADGTACDENSSAVPLVDPNDGTVYTAFENFNRACCLANQYIVVKSTDGGQSWASPVKISDVIDGPDAYPICEGSQVLDDMCARTGVSVGNIDLNPSTGHLYATWFDNRNGTADDTNADVFVSISTDAGATWSEPIDLTEGSVADQWQPWLSVAPRGQVVVSYFDRQYDPAGVLIDTSLTLTRNEFTSFSTRRVSEVSWNADFSFRLGLFMGDYTGLDTTAKTALPFWTDARFGEANVDGNNPPLSQSDVMVDVEPLGG